MKKISGKGLKALKLVHILLVVLFLGGIISCLAINLGISTETYEEAYMTYKTSIAISEYVIKIGAQGTIIIGLIYGFFTNWGFFKHRWITIKWIVWVAQTVIGIFVVDKLMMSNMALLESEKALALSNPVFIQNDTMRIYAVILQIILATSLIAISIYKPGKSKKAKVE